MEIFLNNLKIVKDKNKLKIMNGDEQVKPKAFIIS